MEKKILDFIQQNSPDGGFLQSGHWRSFQEVWGRKAHSISASGNNGEPLVFANIIEHVLPIVGKYFYIPRGPVACNTKHVTCNNKIQKFLNELVYLAGKNNAGWIRIEPNSEEELKLIHENFPKNIKIKKSSVDMQSREILMMDISRSDEDILAQMKQKTRYNIKLAEKKGVKINNSREEAYIKEFLRLVEITAKRDKITSHPDDYYKKMFEIIPDDVLKLYVAEYDGKIIAANLALFFGRTATYMHGASDNDHRNTMAPYLLQWQQIVDARKAGCERYDFGGIKTCDTKHVTCNKNSWSGITKFKQGFAPGVESVQFPGSYDIILKPARYNLYRALQKIKRIF
ncbi:MAG: peptidoglycan bridge formation glycyltransferase FemA/FemB family protein [Parcubacteria group bacterium]|jgi:lipid II:glycine glycyltransferase (peptidoglycan interpeptide bridge formation enzyme)